MTEQFTGNVFIVYWRPHTKSDRNTSHGSVLSSWEKKYGALNHTNYSIRNNSNNWYIKKCILKIYEDEKVNKNSHATSKTHVQLFIKTKYSETYRSKLDSP